LARLADPMGTLPAAATDLASWQRRHADLEWQLAAIRRHAPSTPPAVATARTLPHDVVAFTGRDRELGHLTEAITSAMTAGSVGIFAIDGMAGVGKTALAVHAAHQLARRFPDGQLFVDLHAHTAGQSPVSSADALHALLPAVGVEPSAIPQSLDERSALWRSRLASRRILVLLDNASGHDQVRPLLPGAAGACVLITGRRRLAALDGALMMPLDILSPAEAAELFVRTAGTGDPRSEAVHELARQVGYLPLAIRLLAGRLRSRPTWTVEDLVGELATAKDRSAAIRAENVAVGAVFDLSFDALPARLKPMFRSLGLYPGVDFDASAAAALAGFETEEAQHGLDVLYNDHLVEEPARGRYRFHDLVRDYARGLARPEDSQEAHEAMTRLLAHYREMTGAADEWLRGQGSAGVLTDRAAAVAWLDTELPNLIATIEHTAGRHNAAAEVSRMLRRYLQRHGHWRHAVMLYQTTLHAARTTADRADALRGLGVFYRLLGDFAAAESHLAEALSLYDELDDRDGRSDALAHIGVVLRLQGHYRAALDHATQSLELYEEMDSQDDISSALSEICTLRSHLGDHAAARESALAALRVCDGLNDQVREASVLRALGFAEWNGGLLDAAEDTLRRSLRLARDTNFRIGEADALHNLGIVLGRQGRFAQAWTVLGEALEIFIDLGSARGQLTTLNDLGNLLHDRDPRSARRHHVLALRMARSITNPPREAQSWEGIGRSLVAGGDIDGGLRRLRRALSIHRRFGEHDVRELEELIAELEGGDRRGR
jgi:tetratricopeptide (TPR) repeat protein